MLAYLAIVFQVGPAPGEFDEHPPGSHGDTGGDFDQPRLPGAGMPFSQRVALTSTVVVLATLWAGEGLDGNLCRFGFGWRIGDQVTKANQQVVGRSE